MFTAGGQIDLSFACVARGGGGKGGGGSSAPTVAPTYVDPVDGTVFYDPKDLNDHIAARKTQEALDTATAKTAADTKAAQDLADFNTKKSGAYNDALAAVERTFTQQGLDYKPYLSTDIEPQLKADLATIKDLDPNPAAAFPSTLGSTIIGNLTSGTRTKATNALNSIFTPNYANTLIPDTADDPYISQIVNEQFDPLSVQLTNAQKRGTLTDTGYKSALDVLGQKKTAATDTVSNLGQGILTKDRGDISDLISGARTTASGLGLNDTFDPSTYQTQTTSRATSDLGNLAGALRNAVGGTKFADLTELINAGGAVQGAVNTPVANPAGAGGAILDPNNTINNNRGLGNTGQF